MHALALVLFALGTVSPLTYNGETYTSDTPTETLRRDSGLSDAEWARQDRQLHDVLGRELYRDYADAGNDFTAMDVEVNLGRKFHPLLAYYVAKEYDRVLWMQLDAAVYFDGNWYVHVYWVP